MLRQYEVLLLTVPEITQDEESSIEKGIDRLVSGAKGSVISFEKWGKFKLSYPIKKNDYGVYFLVRFEIPTNEVIMQEIRTFFAVKLHEIVMRALISKLDPRRSTNYQRPKSLEEAPAERGVDAFLKKNKAGGFDKHNRLDDMDDSSMMEQTGGKKASHLYDSMDDDMENEKQEN